MKILITGVCGFVGSSIAKRLTESVGKFEIIGIDNFIRPGSPRNLESLQKRGVKIHHGDIRNQSDFESLPSVDWVIDAAANPSVLAGVDGKSSSRQLIEHNLQGTINILEYCKQYKAGLTLLSTSRVYSIKALSELAMKTQEGAYQPIFENIRQQGLTPKGINESFPTTTPISLYGSTKLSSENLAFEYAATFNFPIFINRCGVLAGSGQFGRPDQGIFSYWLNSHLRKQAMKYIGFDGKGHQTRDCLHPFDLTDLIQKQIAQAGENQEYRPYNVSGGTQSAFSLKQMTQWCETRWGQHEVTHDPIPRKFDIPWIILDSSDAIKKWTWSPEQSTESILEEIALHAEANSNWLKISSPY